MIADIKRLARRTRNALGSIRIARGPELVGRFDDATGTVVECRVELPAASVPPCPARISPNDLAPLFEAAIPAKFGERSPFVAVLEEGRVIGDGRGVLDADSRLVGESLWDDDHYLRDFHRRRVPPDRARVGGDVVSLLSLWDSNYYHWLIDALPRLAVLEASGLAPGDARFLVPDDRRSFQRDSLAMLGVTPDRQVVFDGASLRAERLVWPSPAATIGYCTPFVAGWLRRSLANGAAAGDPVKIYLARRIRRVANEAEVWPVLRERGFERVYAEDLSLAEQVGLFARARQIVGPHGAGMVNAVFATGARVLEFFQPGYVNTGPFQVSRAAGHAYWAVVGTALRTAGDAKDADIAVDVHVLGTVLDEMEAAAP